MKSGSGLTWSLSMVVALVVVLASVTRTEAQEQHQHQHDPNEKLGRVHFPISCSKAAQEQFDRAIALLHSFQYSEAGDALARISAIEPDCAMASWGEAMSLYHPLWVPPSAIELQRGRTAAEKASAAQPKTQRERDYVAAIRIFYRDSDKVDHWTRARAYAAAMERVYLRYPRDREAAIFYALALNGTAPASDKNLASRTKAARILYRIWPSEPDHPGIAHYLIHSYDYPSLAHLALPAARRYAKVAPSSSHALHMPSHIFTRLGMWKDSINSNLASAAAAKLEVDKQHPEMASQNELHALDYLAYAYLQQAQDDLAIAILKRAQSYSAVDQVVFQAAYAWSAIPARIALERHRWDEAASLALIPSTFPWDRFGFGEANVRFARAMGSAKTGDIAAARREIAAIDSILAGLSREGYDWPTQVRIQRQSASAYVALAEGDRALAERLLREAAELEDRTDKHPVTPGSILPAREMLGDLLLELKRPLDALREYELTLRTTPNRFNSVAGAARAAELAGNGQKARSYYAKLVRLCSDATGPRPKLQHARKYLGVKP
jgi:tetratricopeptide (TPR) repeat protein